jgi:gamma-glutamylputrescine oxidase
MLDYLREKYRQLYQLPCFPIQENFLHIFPILGSIFDMRKFISDDIASSRDMEGIPEEAASSYWDSTVALEQDYIVIGAGIVGLSTAIEIKKAEPRARVLVVERGVLAAGASTRNAGIACFGSFTEIYEDVLRMGEEKAVTQVRERFLGLKALRAALGDENICFHQRGSYELIGSELMHLLEHVGEVNDLLRPIFGEDVFVRVDEKIAEFSFSKEHVCALLYNPFEGEIDSGVMMESLQQKAQIMGIIIRFGSTASRPYEEDGKTKVSIVGGSVFVEELVFTARGVAICTNGFLSELVPDVKIRPCRGQILVTAAMENPTIPRSTFHMGKGFWYFRLLKDRRILLGGGRNLNFSAESTSEFKITPDIMGPLKSILSRVITPGIDHSIDFAWAGIMGFSEENTAIIEKVSGLSKVVLGFGCNGMGIARGYYTGEKTAIQLINVLKNL